MLRSSLCDFSDASIFVKGNITVNNTAGAGANCAAFTKCTNKINNTQIDNAEYIDIVMLMHDL